MLAPLAEHRGRFVWFQVVVAGMELKVLDKHSRGSPIVGMSPSTSGPPSSLTEEGLGSRELRSAGWWQDQEKAPIAGSRPALFPPSASLDQPVVL